MQFVVTCLKSILVIILFLIFSTKTSYAKIRFTLQAPTEKLTRGQIVTFLINIDTQDTSLSSTAIVADYKTEYLQFEQAVPGNTFSVIKTSPISNGRILIEGTNSSAFSGQGVYAYLKFKLIAQAPGGTELCVLSAPPSVTESPLPTTPQSISKTPTELPQTGSVEVGNIAKIFGVLFIATALATLTIKKINRFNE